MIWSRKIFMLCALILFLLFGSRAYPQPGEGDEKTLSPYFFVRSGDPTIDRLPLKSTSARVNISGVIADVQVSQLYKNEGRRTLEAIYVFPASTRAAVHGMRMIIGPRVIEAKIQERENARRDYEQARERGQSASLLEQQRPNVLQMNVANILPGDEIRVELRYTELLVPTERRYEFIYPTVVGPRYANQPAETAPASEAWTRNPYLHQGEAPSDTFDMTVEIAAGMPIRDLSCPSHKVHASFAGPENASVRLDPSEARGGNRDYILRYRLGGDGIQSGLLLWENQKENFFLLMMQPPRKVATNDIPGREYIFIVDVSGSMYGFPIEISKKLLIDLVGNLRPTDRFNVLLFSGGSTLLAEESLSATPTNIRRAIHIIEHQRGGGGTELLPALTRALRLPKPKGYSRTFVIATDGYVTVEEEVFDLIRKNLNRANMFTFGIGSSVNRYLIEGMARAGMGESFVVTKPGEAAAAAERFRNLIQTPLLTGIQVRFDQFATYDVEPMAVPDVMAERPIVLFGKWRGRPRGTIFLTGTSGNGPYAAEIDVGKVKPMETNSALRYLWARHRIALLSDYNERRFNNQRKEEVIRLGLDYHLLTAYTSFVAIDSQVRNPEGGGTPVTQPLPLPAGVSDFAVGGTKCNSLSLPLMAAKEVLSQAKPRGKGPEEERPGAGGIRISLKDVRVGAGMAKEAVLPFLQKKIAALEASLAKEKGIGELVLQLLLDSQGKVKSVKILSAALQNSQMQEKIRDEMKNWVFPMSPAFRGGQIVLSLVVAS